MQAYIFDIGDFESVSKIYVFRGTQFGEYFGYSVLTDDLNGDGLTDVVVSAPQYSINAMFDNGAIYVFLNQGRVNIVFYLSFLRSSYYFVKYNF